MATTCTRTHAYRIHSAVSEDLIAWTVVLGGDQKYRGRPEQRSSVPGAAPKIVFSPRRGFFDSELVEPGPPALLLPSGAEILLIYNSKVNRQTPRLSSLFSFLLT